MGEATKTFVTGPPQVTATSPVGDQMGLAR